MSNITINIAEDGGTVQVGDKTYQVTLITPAEPKPEIPEPTLTVPDNVEFAMWGESFALRYNGLTLSSKDGEQHFALESGVDYLDTEKNLKLIPCKLDEVQNGEWFVNKIGINDASNYWLVTTKGAVSFCSDEKPIETSPIDSDDWGKEGWLKVVQA